MPPDLLHKHPQFADLIRIVADSEGIAPALVEKDYWIMQSLYGLQQLGLTFELKGGTSLSKGYGLISRFSEDIDIRIEPPADPPVMSGRNHDKPAHVQSRKDFYDRLAQTIVIDGITVVERDPAFDDERQYRSAGIRLAYDSINGSVEGLKDGVLLEVGFDDVAPNQARDISSWAYDYAASRVELLDNRALAVACYHPGHTLVEKLQAISTKFRQQQETGVFPPNFMRHYYDVYCLLQDPAAQAFAGTPAYLDHKAKRFPKADNPIIAKNEAFVLSDPEVRQKLQSAYAASSALYFRGQPAFDDILAEIASWAPKL
ncbi:nucleotidyl transferase AbiEii/AbiGii toxin family protein [Phenylobacterium aquaticum]|uniref:nucleotidyl transferase AbiEii/AbiGii toxin family protein n=1 Tax=Phenylobacterium aquaticum TaxID=1763816 RepID=UPI001F5CE149|nr:nucleotidyl transferase AbiEii/AbiGii toxin family protein [Phenylobacterium aquaticum]MCI3130948.1 nucleotidyl transferase AbiEii/AbiGii toxin family protein [Phenylobacterium aquaticum]